MRNIFRRILILAVCILFISSFVSAQQNIKTDDINETDIERTFSIPSNISSDFSEESSGSGSTAWLFIRMVLVLALICLIIWFVGKLIKKRMNPGAEPDLYLKKTAQLTLAPGKTVQIVTLREKAYILGVSDSGISVIDKIDGYDDKDKSQIKELIDDMNLHAGENLTSKPQDFASMISSLSSSSKRTENFIKTRRLNFRKNGENR